MYGRFGQMRQALAGQHPGGDGWGQPGGPHMQGAQGHGMGRMPGQVMRRPPMGGEGRDGGYGAGMGRFGGMLQGLMQQRPGAPGMGGDMQGGAGGMRFAQPAGPERPMGGGGIVADDDPRFAGQRR